MNNHIFHLAFPINDIAKSKQFYAAGLGCEVGRESPTSVIFNLCGHQLVAHVTKEPLTPQKGIYPRHFGIVFSSEADWEAMLQRAKDHGLSFYQEPKHRFTDLPLEHRTFFLEDPFHNLLEFKYYYHSDAIFGQRDYTQVGDTVSE
ncbi:VOC family protein [[Phormidium] sp. ETS-05]|uniref:VOC family protein n=1 Tax=[Phormidium] sp. ETS-05 TaxID=222819 RepID=UPI0018EEDC54|nr:VOC family protein [[Phormidium] sp. ETS-05]